MTPAASCSAAPIDILGYVEERQRAAERAAR